MARYEDNTSEQGIFISLNLSNQFDVGSRESILKKYIADNVDLTQFDSEYNNDVFGRKVKNPRDVISAILYGYMTGNRSSRMIEEMLRQHVGFMYISNCLMIDHSVICDFKVKFKEQIQNIFTNLLFLLNEMNAIDWDIVVGDGTKIKAFASKSRTIGKEKTQKIIKSYRLMAQKVMLRDIDLEKSRENGEINGKRYQEEKQRTTRLKRTYENILSSIKKYTESEDSETKKLLETKHINLTDPDSNVMTGSSRRHFIQGYNATMMVSNNDVILDYKPIIDAEKNHTADMVHRVEKLKVKLNVSAKTKYLLDKGYQDTKKILELQSEGLDMYVATKERDFTNKAQKRKNFSIVHAGTESGLKCKGQHLGNPFCSKDKQKIFFYFKEKDCAPCPYYGECYKDIKKSAVQKTVSFSFFEINNRPQIDAYLNKINSEEGKRIYSRRIGKEHVFSNIKTQRNFHQTYYRGNAKVSMDICWAALAQNMQKYIINKQ
jgi:transposase